MKRYVVWNRNNREGEFEFLTSTQDHWTSSLKTAQKEKRELFEEYRTNYDPPLSIEEAEEECSLVILELRVREIK